LDNTTTKKRVAEWIYAYYVDRHPGQIRSTAERSNLVLATPHKPFSESGITQLLSFRCNPVGKVQAIKSKRDRTRLANQTVYNNFPAPEWWIHLSIQSEGITSPPLPFSNFFAALLITWVSFRLRIPVRTIWFTRPTVSCVKRAHTRQITSHTRQRQITALAQGRQSADAACPTPKEP
jgi:hypothetical protein